MDASDVPPPPPPEEEDEMAVMPAHSSSSGAATAASHFPAALPSSPSCADATSAPAAPSLQPQPKPVVPAGSPAFQRCFAAWSAVVSSVPASDGDKYNYSEYTVVDWDDSKGWKNTFREHLWNTDAAAALKAAGYTLRFYKTMQSSSKLMHSTRHPVLRQRIQAAQVAMMDRPANGGALKDATRHDEQWLEFAQKLDRALPAPPDSSAIDAASSGSAAASSSRRSAAAARWKHESKVFHELSEFDSGAAAAGLAQVQDYLSADDEYAAASEALLVFFNSHPNDDRALTQRMEALASLDNKRSWTRDAIGRSYSSAQKDLSLRQSMCGCVRYYKLRVVRCLRLEQLFSATDSDWDRRHRVIRLLKRIFIRKRSRLFAIRLALTVGFHLYVLATEVRLRSLMIYLLVVTSLQSLLVLYQLRQAITKADAKYSMDREKGRESDANTRWTILAALAWISDWPFLLYAYRTEQDVNLLARVWSVVLLVTDLPRLVMPVGWALLFTCSAGSLAEDNDDYMSSAEDCGWKACGVFMGLIALGCLALPIVLPILLL